MGTLVQGALGIVLALILLPLLRDSFTPRLPPPVPRRPIRCRWVGEELVWEELGEDGVAHPIELFGEPWAARQQRRWR